MPAILPARYDIPPQTGRAVPKDFPPGEDGTLRAHYGAVSIGIDHYYGNSSNPGGVFSDDLSAAATSSAVQAALSGHSS
jgi:hypothetical protein